MLSHDLKDVSEIFKKTKDSGDINFLHSKRNRAIIKYRGLLNQHFALISISNKAVVKLRRHVMFYTFIHLQFNNVLL